MADEVRAPASDRPASAPPQAPESDETRAARLAAELEATQARLAAGGGETIALRVAPPHQSISYGGLTVRSDPTPVPLRHVAALETAAADAGVELIRED